MTIPNSDFRMKDILYNHFVYNNPSDENFKFHTHDICELIFLKQGNIKAVIDGKEYKLYENSLVIFKPNVVHRIKIEDDTPYASQTQNSSAQKHGMSKSTKIFLIILLVLTSPLWIGVVVALFGGLLGLLGGLFGTIVGLGGAGIGLVVSGIVCIVGGILCLVANPMEGLAVIGVGAIFAAIGILLSLLGVWFVGVWLPQLVKALVNWIKGLFHRNEGGNVI